VDIEIHLSADRRSFIVKGWPRFDDASEDRLNALAVDAFKQHVQELLNGTQLALFANRVLSLSEEGKIQLSEALTCPPFSLMLPNEHLSSTSCMPFRFMNLPVELRGYIYQYYFDLPQDVTTPEELSENDSFFQDMHYVDDSYLLMPHSFFRVSRQIRQETLPLFLAKSLFLFDLDNKTHGYSGGIRQTMNTLTKQAEVATRIARRNTGLSPG